MNGKGNGKLFIFASKVSDLTVLGLIWILTSLPVITIGASSTALYYAVVKSVRFEEGKPLQEYFRSFRQNFLQGCLGTMIYLLLGGMLWIVYQMPQGKGYQTMLSVSAVLLFSSALYFFPILSRFTLNAYQCFQASLFMIFRAFPKTLALVFTGALCVLVFAILPFLLPILAGCYTFYSSVLLEKVFREYMNLRKEDHDLWFMQRENE